MMVRLALLLAVSTAPLPLSAARSELGVVHFETSCRAEVRAKFDDALALLHSFEFEDAESAFGEIEHDDPRCTIAAWGMALAKTERDGADAPQRALAAGWEQLRPWLSLKPGTQREEMYLDAIRAMYEGYSNTPGNVRWKRYLDDMAAIRRQYPRDTDASLFYALGLVWTAGPGAPGIAQRRQALDILLPIFKEFPNHPGAAHYIIHAADTPELASIALPAARAYAKIAPSSPHALHMPSHIFSRLGYWPEMIQSNEDSARAGAKWIKSGRDGRFDELHALTYLEYGYLQLNQREKARGQIARIRELVSSPGGDRWGEIDARIVYDVETEDWQDALKIEAPAESPSRDNFDVYLVHALAAAGLGQVAAARESLQSLSESVSQQKSFTDVLHVYLLQAKAAVQAAEGKPTEAVNRLREASLFEREHRLDYPNILSPPSQESLAVLLFKLHRREDSIRAFQEALAVAPNRWKSLKGLSEARSESAH